MNIFNSARLLTGLFLLSQFSFYPSISFSQELREDISSFMQSWGKRHRIGNNNVAYALIDVENGEIKEQHNGNQVQSLASVSKMFTAQYVLGTLNEDSRFQTTVLGDGPISNGILKGKLVLQGNGDPMLFIPELTFLCEQLSKKGIKKVEGDFYYDDQFPSHKEEISSLGLGDQSYNSGISGLNINFNRIELYRQNKDWISLPPISSFHLIASDKEFAPGVRFSRDPLAVDFEQWEYKRNGKYDLREELPMKRPGLHAASFLQLQCKQYGVELPNAKPWSPSPYKRFKGKILAEHKSLPIREIQRLALEYSNNIMAESSLLFAATKDTEMPTTLREASVSMLEWNKKQFPDLPWSDVTLINGSGISSENKSSPMLLARWLAVVEKSHTTTRSLKTLLPLVGHSGWISARFKYPDVTHRMWAKTGSLDYVTNLAGYMVGKDQKMYAFALLFSDQQNRTYLDTYNDKHADYLRQKAPSERRKLSSKIDEILVHWLNKY